MKRSQDRKLGAGTAVEAMFMVVFPMSYSASFLLPLTTTGPARDVIPQQWAGPLSSITNQANISQTCLFVEGDRTQHGLFWLQVHVVEWVERQVVALAGLAEGSPVEMKLQGGWGVLCWSLMYILAIR